MTHTGCGGTFLEASEPYVLGGRRVRDYRCSTCGGLRTMEV